MTTQHDYVIANQSHTAFRADLNDALLAIASQNSGASAPSTTYAYQLWADTANALWKIRDSTNSSWLTIGPIAPTQAVQRSYLGIDPANLGASVAGNALTITLKSAAGADGSTALPIPEAFRSATLTSGAIDSVSQTASQSLVVSSGSTLGTSNSTPFRLWVVQFNDGNTLRLGVVNCLSGANIMALVNDALYSSTAEGGAGAADSAQTIYTSTAVTSKAITIKGYMEWSSGLATAGSWSSGPTKIQDFGPGVPLPGAVLQVARNATGAVATGTTTIPADDTIPQNTEGDQYMSQAITPLSAANVLEVRAQGIFSNATSSTDHLVAALFQDSTANALAVVAKFKANTSIMHDLALSYAARAGTTSATTFKLRAGQTTAGTTTFNGTGGSRQYGGALGSFMEVREVMA